MDYYIYNGQFYSDDELEHAAVRGNKGWVKPDHKYLDRKWKNGRWVYTYFSDNQTVKNPSPKAVKENLEQDKYVEKLNSNKDPIYPFSYDKYRKYQQTPKSGLDKLKDELGFDERDMYKQTAKKYNRAMRLLNESKSNAKDKQEHYESVRNRSGSSQRVVDDSYTRWKNAERIVSTDQHYAERYGEAFVRSQEEFFKTPLGKLHKAKESVKSWVNERIKDMKGWLKSLTRL